MALIWLPKKRRFNAKRHFWNQIYDEFHCAAGVIAFDVVYSFFSYFLLLKFRSFCDWHVLVSRHVCDQKMPLHFCSFQGSITPTITRYLLPIEYHFHLSPMGFNFKSQIGNTRTGSEITLSCEGENLDNTKTNPKVRFARIWLKFEGY